MAIAHTRTRLKGYLTLKASPVGVELAEYHVDVTQDPAFQKMVVIGAASVMTIDQKREGHFRREFDPDLNGKPAETYPGLSSYTVTLDRVDLYDANMLEAFHINGVNVAEQYKALVLVAEQPVPIKDDGTPLSIDGNEFKTRTLIMPGCWINGFTIEWNIDDEDQKYVTHVEMVVRDVIASAS